MESPLHHYFLSFFNFTVEKKSTSREAAQEVTCKGVSGPAYIHAKHCIFFYTSIKENKRKEKKFNDCFVCFFLYGGVVFLVSSVGFLSCGLKFRFI